MTDRGTSSGEMTHISESTALRLFVLSGIGQSRLIDNKRKGEFDGNRG